MSDPLTYIIFAKYPEPGAVKTRLAASIGADSACRLYKAMLLDIIERITARGQRTAIHVFPAAKCAEFASWLSLHLPSAARADIIAQRGANLGDRMYNAFADHRERGHGPAIIIGSDSPTIPQSTLDEAEQLMTANSEHAIIGATSDGGFYLMGLPFPHRDLFFGADYSNDSVYRRSHRAMEGIFKEVRTLEPWYDIDDKDALHRLQNELALDRPPYSRRTAACLENIVEAREESL